MSSRRSKAIAVAVSLWLGAVGLGFAALQHYAAQPGPAYRTAAEDRFLAEQRAPGRALLVMALHPHCPCSEASLAEVRHLLDRPVAPCDVLLLQYEPERDAEGWAPARPHRLLDGAEMRVVPDRGGRIAATLGALTSGHVVFVDAGGVVRYAGGLTPSRGHRGRTVGHDAILAALAGREPVSAQAPVYGCALAPECAAPPLAR